MSGSLTHSPSSIIRQLLVDKSLGVLPSADGDWPIFITQEPDTPDSVITLRETTSRLSGRSMPSGQVIEHYGIQIRVRDANHQDGFDKAEAIMIALDEDVLRETVTVDGTDYAIQSVSRSTGIVPLGKEPTSNRDIFTINVTTALRQTT